MDGFAQNLTHGFKSLQDKCSPSIQMRSDCDKIST